MKRPLLLATLLLAACNTDVDPQFRVKDVRVLAIRSTAAPPSTSADVRSGETVVLDALVANPAARAGLTIAWFACLPPASDAVSPCNDLSTLSDPSRLTELAATNPLVRALGTGPTVQLVVPDLTQALEFAIRRVRTQPTYACQLYREIVVAVVASAEGRSSVAVKAVRVVPTASQLAAAGVTSHYELNLNPLILGPAGASSAGGVYFAPVGDDGCEGGTPLASAPLPAGKTVVCGRSASTAVGSFELCNTDGTFRTVEEKLTWQWYVTDGDFPEVGGVGNVRGERRDFTRPAGGFTLWSILRDERGGTDWVTVAVSTL